MRRWQAAELWALCGYFNGVLAPARIRRIRLLHPYAVAQLGIRSYGAASHRTYVRATIADR
jgi:hypothetical protein